MTCVLAAVVAAPALHAQPSLAVPDIVYPLKPGDTPWGIGQQYLDDVHDWRQLVRRNGYADSTRLPTGTPLRIPQSWLRREPAPITVLATFDQVELQAADGSLRPLQVGSVLVPGDRLTTSERASVTLASQDGSQILVRPGTELVLTESSRPVDLPGAQAASNSDGLSPIRVQLQLWRGAVENAVRTLGPTGRFQIRTPAAVAAVRGTELRVAVAGDTTTTELLQGEVLIAGNQGKTLNLRPGQGTRAVLGQPPEPPTQLLPAPDPASLPREITRLPLDLPLPLLIGAVGWRMQLFALPSTALVSDLVSDGARLRAGDLPDGEYKLSLRAIDAGRLEGLAAERTMTVRARPVPPLQIAPAPDARTGDARPEFRWSQAAGDGVRREIRLQVAPTPDFGQPLIDLTVPDEGRLRAPVELGVGRWWWRLLVIDPTLGAGPLGDAESFERVLPGPGAAPPDVDGDNLTLRWSTVPGASGYRVQVARDEAFSAPVVDQTVQADRIVLTRPEAGDYYLRLQTLDAEGTAGTFSPTEKFNVEQPVNYWQMLWLLAPLLLAF